MSLILTRYWIGGCAWLVMAGWVLSMFGVLNRAGYGVALGVGVLVLVWGVSRRSASAVRLRWRRFRRGWPLAFAVVFAAMMLGGVLYFPANYDALSYRVPRVLHWLAEGRWHWIESEHVRLNTRATGVEWMMAPVLLFLRSERWVWLFNAAMLAMLPGLIYSAYVSAGGRRRVAWSLMWLLPSAYVFVVQAGGDSNDLPGAFFALAAVALALHARRSGRAGDWLLSMIAMALAIGTKLSNAPLALVWLVAAWPTWRVAMRRSQLAAGAAAVAAVCSFLPNAILNVRYCGEWSGASREFGYSVIHGPAWVHVVGNAISLTVQNLTPPVFPWAGKWNATAPRLVPAGLTERLAAGLEEGDHLWTAYEMPTEDSAALGPVVVVALGALVGGAVWRKRAGTSGDFFGDLTALLCSPFRPGAGGGGTQGGARYTRWPWAGLGAAFGLGGDAERSGSGWNWCRLGCKREMKMKRETRGVLANGRSGVGDDGEAADETSNATRQLRDRLSKPRIRGVLAGAAVVAFGVFLVKMTVLCTGRLAAPYYLLLPLALVGSAGAERVVRTRWWRGLGWVQFATALLVLVISPARPLWPALTVLSHLPESVRAKPLVQRATVVYTRYRERADALAPVRALLPAEAKTVGLISINDLEASLWRPFGERRFVPVSPGRSREWFRERGIEYLVVSERTYVGLWRGGHQYPPLEEWVREMGGEVVGRVMVASHVSEPPYRWHVVRVKR